MATMLIGGLWHGAGWTFIVWGGLHGVCLVLNHGFRAFRRWLGHDLNRSSRLGRSVSVVITFAVVTCGWVIFRAESFGGACAILKGMLGLNGVALPYRCQAWLNYCFGLGDFLAGHGCQFLKSLAPGIQFYWGKYQVAFLATLFLIAWCLPNTLEFMHRHRPVKDGGQSAAASLGRRFPAFRFNFANAFVLAMIVMVSLLAMQTIQKTEFLYYDF